MAVEFVLHETLEKEGVKLTRNAIAVRAQVRPATLHDIAKQQAKSISLETLEKILDAMNELDETRSYDIGDIIRYENDK